MRLIHLYPLLTKEYFRTYLQKRTQDLHSPKKEVSIKGRSKPQKRPLKQTDKITITQEQKRVLDDLFGGIDI
jgi:hypothetical protein